LPEQVGKIATVIDVGMRKHHGIDFLRLEPEILILFVGVFAPALVEPAVEQDLLTIDL
jgi:hypothetical protein